MLARIVALFSLMTLGFLVGIWSMISGWGLEAKNWPVIIGAFFLQVFIMSLTTEITNE